jgi:hypothetical protein
MKRHGCMHQIATPLRGMVFSALVVLLSGCLPRSTLTPSPAHDTAPIVVDVKASRCDLSPGGSFIAVQQESSQESSQAVFTFYDRATKDAIPLPDHVGLMGVWLDDTTWFEYTEQTFVGDTYEPTDGWLIDLTHGIVTDILSLSPAEQTTILTEVKAYLRAYFGPVPTHGDISPDGQYEALGSRIYAAGKLGSSAVKAEFPTTRSTAGCRNGWNPDSSGYYFIERGFALRGYPPGPIRFLPINP